MRVEQIGNATLYLGDCLEILPTLPKVDAVITDPPYGIALAGHAMFREVARETTSRIAGDATMEVGIKALQWADENADTTVAFASPRKPWPGDWRNWICWDKGGAVGGGGDPVKCLKMTWELIQQRGRLPLFDGRQESVWRITKMPGDSPHHICEKPVTLMSRILQVFTAEDMLVVDPFMGSASTGVACLLQGRSFIGIEREVKYFDIACERISRAVSQGQLFEPEQSAPEQLVFEAATCAEVKP